MKVYDVGVGTREGLVPPEQARQKVTEFRSGIKAPLAADYSFSRIIDVAILPEWKFIQRLDTIPRTA